MVSNLIDDIIERFQVRRTFEFSEDLFFRHEPVNMSNVLDFKYLLEEVWVASPTDEREQAERIVAHV